MASRVSVSVCPVTDSRPVQHVQYPLPSPDSNCGPDCIIDDSNKHASMHVMSRHNQQKLKFIRLLTSAK